MRGKIAYKQQRIIDVVGLAQKSDDAVIRILKIDPLESAIIKIERVESRLCLQQTVQITDQALQTLVRLVIEQMPIQTLVFLPFLPLADFRTHEQQFLAGMAKHESQKSAQVGEFLPKIAGHLVQQGALAVHHLVMAQDQDEILMKSIEQSKSDHVVVIFAIDGIFGKIGQKIVHPTHIPFEIESKPTEVGGFGNARPGGRFFGDHHHPGIIAENQLVQAFEEIDCLEVFAAAVLVGNPLPCFARVIEVDHGSHGIDPQPIDMVLFQPKQGVGDEKIAHFVAAIIEDQRTPILVLAFSGILMLVEMRTVKTGQAVSIPRKMGRYPIEDDADTILVAVIDKKLKIIGGAKPGGGGKISGHLIAPRPVQGVFGDRQQLNVGIPHFLDIGDKFPAEVPVGKKILSLLPFSFPRSQMHLIDRDRLLQRISAAPFFEVLGVAPGVTVHIGDDRGGLRSFFKSQTVRIGLDHPVAGLILDLEFVFFSNADIGNKEFPNSRSAEHPHLMFTAMPLIEVADYADIAGIRRPDSKIDTSYTFDAQGMSAQFFIDLVVIAHGKKITIQIADLR